MWRARAQGIRNREGPPIPIAASKTGAVAPAAGSQLPGSRPGGMLRSLQHRDFRLFWIGLGLALTGFQVQRVALGFLAYDLTGSALFLTLVFGGDSLPMIVLSPIGGVVVDRVNRKTLLLVTRLLIAITGFSVGILVLTGLVAAWHLLIFALATGVLYAFDIPARQAAIRDLVPEEDFFNAVALSSSIIQASRIVGPAIGGLALVTTGPGGAFLCMGAGNLGQVLMVALTRLPHRPLPRTQGTLANLKDGFRFILRNEPVWMLMLMAAIPALFSMTYQSLTPVFAEDVLGQGRGAIGAMLTAAGIGALAGSMAVAAAGERFGRPTASALAAVVFSLVVVLFALSPSYPLSLALLVVVGMTGAIYSVSNSTLVQSITPRELQGRVMGVYQLTWNVQLGGSLLIGAMADAAGAPAALTAAGFLSAALVLALLGFRQRQGRKAQG